MKNHVLSSFAAPMPSAPQRAALAWVGLLAFAILQTACSTYSPGSLRPGATVEAAQKSMGPPTGTYTRPEGGQRLEFARGPQGKDTFMLDFDANGHLLKTEQVLNPANFEAVRRGDTQAKVLYRLGRPSETSIVGHGDYLQPVWSYRYDSYPFCLWFQINFDAQKRVVDGSYAPDPRCEPNN